MAKVIWRTGKILIVVLMALAVIFTVGLSVWTKAQTFEENYIEDPNDGSAISTRDIEPVIRNELTDRRGRNRRVWEVVREVEIVDPVTQAIEIDEQVSRIIEVGTGICYQDDLDQWQMTDASWYITDNGFAMDRAGYKLEIGFTVGSWLNYTVDDELMHLRPDAIIAFDGSNMEIIAEVDGNVVGQIDPDDPSKLIFPDAFGDGIDLELEAMPAGFHQNVIFNNKPELKGDFDIDKTRIHVFTELNLDEYSRDGMMDVAAGEEIRFGTAQITDTVAALEDITFIKMFTENDELFEYNLHRFGDSIVFDSGNGSQKKKDVAKKSLVNNQQGRSFLVETLDKSFFETASYPVTWDYSDVSGTFDPDDGHWYADTTYYVSDDLEVDEGELRIEPGTFVKFAAGKKLFTSGTGKVIARGRPYLPIYFVSKDDNNNGESITGSDGSTGCGDWVGLEIGDDSEVEYCKIMNAETALTVSGTPAINIRDIQTGSSLDCAIDITSDAGTVTIFNNSLIYSNGGTDPTAIKIDGSSGSVSIINNTFDTNAKGIAIDASCTRQITAMNNILANSSTAGIYAPGAYDPNYLANNYNGYYNNTADISGVSSEPNSVTITETPYATDTINIIGRCLNTNTNGGAKFIDAGSCFVEAAGFNDPNLWLTLYPQNIYTTAESISSDTTWQPDYDTCDFGTVDLGYHHPRIDYVIHQADVTVSGATLTVAPGTVIGQKINDSTDAGKLIINSDAELICNGEPFGDGYVIWSELGLIKYYWRTYFDGVSDRDTYIDIAGDYEIGFTRFQGMGWTIATGSVSGTIGDCIFELNHCGIKPTGGTGIDYSNNLFINNNRGMHIDGCTGNITNCTFDRCETFGVVTVNSSSTLDITNCLFRKVAASYSGSYAYAAISDWNETATFNESYNAFYDNFIDLGEGTSASTAAQDLDGTDWTDDTGAAYASIINGDPFDFSWTNFADRVRLDQDSDAVDNGYDPDALGMRGYTAFLDNSVDDPNVDIGYHYPLAIDSDGDQLWDYEEHWIGSDPDMVDTDGDGLTDYDEVMIYGTSPILVDTDGDGMPDGWEVLYTNTDALVSDATADLENSGAGDGISNLDEYRYGLDPDVDNEGDYFTYNEYDSSGQVVLTRNIEVEDGEVFATETNTEYDVLGRVKEQRQRAYPGLGPDAGVSHTEDMVVVKSYDVAGNLKKTAMRMTSESDPDVIHPNDIVTENFYDKLGRLVTVTDALDQDTTYTYYAGGKLETVTDPNGAVTTNYYDDSGRLNKVVNALGDYRIMDYDSFGRVVRQVAWQENGATDTALVQNRTVYDDVGRVVIQAVLADASSAAGYVVDPNTDKVTEFVYDGSTGTYPGMLASQSIYFGYDSVSGTSVKATTTFDYDYFGRRVKTTDPDGNETIVSYDSGGRVYRRQQADYHPTTSAKDVVVTTDFEFDDAGRIIKQTAKPSTDPNYSSDWQVSEFVYALGYRIAEEKPNGIISTHEYDSFGKKTKTIADAAVGGLQQTTEWGFDRLGRQVSIAGYTDEDTPSTKQVTGYAYDDLGQVVTITYPDTKTISYDFNKQGKVKRRTDQRGNVTYYDYNDMGILKLRTTDAAVAGDPVAVNDPNYSIADSIVETFTHDGLGRMLTAYKTLDANDVSLVEFAYTDLGRVSDFDQTLFGGTERQTDFSYDQFGFLESTDYPDGTTTIDRTNDWRGRIDTLSRSATELVDYDYVGGRVANRDYSVPNVGVAFDYDGLGRVVDIDYGASVVSFDYSYVSNENNIYRKTFDHRSGDPYNEYSYDDLDRLTGVTYHDTDTEAFNMDDLGNRTGNQALRADGTVSFVVDDDTNRYTSVGGNSISHDDAGNLTVDKDGYQYTYDYENRVVKIEDSSSDDVVEYAYDALGHRIRKVDSKATETTLYYYNPDWQVLAEYDDSNNQQRYFIYGNYIDEPLVMHDTTDFYYVQDHLYSTVALIGYDSSWTVVERYEYDAYGKMTRLDPDFTSWSGTEAGNPYYYTGRRLDVLDSGSLERQHSRYRDYDAYMARFLQPDSSGYIDGLSLYEYVGSNPIGYFDPEGLSAIPQSLRVGAYTIMRQPSKDETPMSFSHETTIVLSNYTYGDLAYGSVNDVGKIRKKIRKVYRSWLNGGSPDAGELLRHYYKNRGPIGSPLTVGGFKVGYWMDVKSVDYAKMIDDVNKAKEHVLWQMESIRRTVEDNPILMHEMSIMISQTGSNSVEPWDNLNWARAIHGYETWHKATNIRCSNGWIKADFSTYLRDIYNYRGDRSPYDDWEKGLGLGGVKPSEFRAMHRIGVMREFYVVGETNYKIRWKSKSRNPIIYSK